MVCYHRDQPVTRQNLTPEHILVIPRSLTPVAFELSNVCRRADLNNDQSRQFNQ